MSKLIEASKAVIELKRKGFLARQNKTKNSPLWVNLGGPKSEIKNKFNKFSGLILLKPLRNLAFGACPEEIKKLHKKVMEEGILKDKRKEGVRGPKNDNRVEVKLNELGEAFCGEYKIEGLIYNLKFNNGYKSIDIQIFLEKLDEYCSKKIIK